MFNGETFWTFLRQLEAASQEPGRRVIVITDNAKYHHAKLHAAWRLEQQERFCLDFLPPYSPELNPIERVWKRTRRNCLHNTYFSRLALVTEAVEKQFTRWSEPNAEPAELCQLRAAINYGVKYSATSRWGAFRGSSVSGIGEAASRSSTPAPREGRSGDRL